MPEKTLPPDQRRRYLLAMLGAVGGALAAMGAWPLVRFFMPRDTGGAGSAIEIPRKDVPPGSAHFFDYRGRPAVLLQPRSGEFLALTAVCTHLGCIVKWQDDVGEFLCPCHGGRFSLDGAVLGGPPPAPLETFPVTLKGDQIVIG
ncbi:MAG: cytochrome B6 [Desulfuromonas sp.]|nr:MAG: cytochrome B6 [Desulfuromonas sp.]